MTTFTFSDTDNTHYILMSIYLWNVRNHLIKNSLIWFFLFFYSNRLKELIQRPPRVLNQCFFSVVVFVIYVKNSVFTEAVPMHHGVFCFNNLWNGPSCYLHFWHLNQLVVLFQPLIVDSFWERIAKLKNPSYHYFPNDSILSPSTLFRNLLDYYYSYFMSLYHRVFTD